MNKRADELDAIPHCNTPAHVSIRITEQEFVSAVDKAGQDIQRLAAAVSRHTNYLSADDVGLSSIEIAIKVLDRIADDRADVKLPTPKRLKLQSSYIPGTPYTVAQWDRLTKGFAALHNEPFTDASPEVFPAGTTVKQALMQNSNGWYTAYQQDWRDWVVSIPDDLPWDAVVTSTVNPVEYRMVEID